MRGRMIRRNRWYKNKKLFGLIIIISVTAVSLYIHALGGAANGSVNTSANTAVVSESPAAKTVRVSGKYISFSHLDTFHALTSQAPVTPQLENFNYSTRQFPSAELAVAVKSFSGSDMSQDSAYATRQKNTAQYNLIHWDVNGQSIPVFSEIGSYSMVAFLLHSDKLATIALSNGANAAQMTSIMQDVVKSLRWSE